MAFTQFTALGRDGDAEHVRGDLDCNSRVSVTVPRVPNCKFTCYRNRCEELPERVTGSWHRCVGPSPSQPLNRALHIDLGSERGLNQPSTAVLSRWRIVRHLTLCRP